MAILTCSICGEPSSDICVFCTKDACGNHRCDRCKRCSDCCECEVPLSAKEILAEPVGAPEPEPLVEEAVVPPVADEHLHSDVFRPEDPPASLPAEPGEEKLF